MPTERVTFLSRGIKLVGDLYRPEKDAPDRKGAGIVIAHPWTGVKEQSSSIYGKQLALRGFIALAYDAAYQGESEGEPRFLEDPAQRVEDIKAGVTFLSLSDGVDPDRIGIYGVCASGGYVCSAAQTDLRVKAVATTSAVCVGVMAREGLPKGSSNMTILTQQLEAAGKDRISGAKGEEPDYVRLLPPKEAGMPENFPTAFQDFWRFYRDPKRGEHPRSHNKVLPRSWDLMGNYDAFTLNWMISPRPLLMVVGSEAETKNYSDLAIEKYSKEPKELFVVPGKTHADMYDYYQGCIDKLEEFFSDGLCK